jgi:hypothetical protein
MHFEALPPALQALTQAFFDLVVWARTVKPMPRSIERRLAIDGETDGREPIWWTSFLWGINHDQRRTGVATGPAAGALLLPPIKKSDVARNFAHGSPDVLVEF